MIINDYNSSSSLVIDGIEKVGERIVFNVTAFLYDKRTDTNIKYETNSFVIIDDWRQKSEALLSQHKLELNNFSFHAVLDQMYSWDNHKISNYNFFELSSNINNSHLNIMIESEGLFGKAFVDEISDAIQYLHDSYNGVSAPCKKDGLILVKQKIVALHERDDDMCDLQIELLSENFRMLRVFTEFYEGTLTEAKQFQLFKDYMKDKFVIPGDYLRIDLTWVNGRIRGIGSIDDLAYPEHNCLSFDDYVSVEYEIAEKKNLPLIQ